MSSLAFSASQLAQQHTVAAAAAATTGSADERTDEEADCGGGARKRPRIDAADATPQTDDENRDGGDDSSQVPWRNGLIKKKWSPPPPLERTAATLTMTLEEARRAISDAEDEKRDALEELTDARTELEEAKRRVEAAERRMQEANEGLARTGRETMAVFLEEEGGSYWMSQYRALIEYGRENANIEVPRRWYDKKTKDDKALRNLGAWIGKNRTLYKREPKGLGPHQIALLDRIEFDWDPKESAFRSKLEKLIQFKEKHGHFETKGFEEEGQLWGFVDNLRVSYKYGSKENYQPHRKKKLFPPSQEHIDALEAVGFTWDKHEFDFEEGFRKLEAFKTVFQHCNVPKVFDPNPELGVWVESIRKHYKRWQKDVTNNNPLTDERMKRLEDLGFFWSNRDFVWNERYVELQQYQREHGTLEVKREINPTLHSWVISQIDSFKNFKAGKGKGGAVIEDRIEALNKIGFVFARKREAKKMSLS